MLNLVPQLFGENRFVIQGIAESHPATILNRALFAVGIRFGGELEDGPIDNDYLKKMAMDENIEKDYWESWKWLVMDQTKDYNLQKFAVETIERAQNISSEERTLIEACKPKTLYMEGCSEFPSSVIGFVAENEGIKVVYLDEGFKPYKEWQKNRFNLNLSYVQRGREAHWIGRVVSNKPKGNSLLITGRNHLIPPSPESVNQEPSRAHIGKFPDLLRAAGVKFEMYIDLSVPRTVGLAPALYRI